MLAIDLVALIIERAAEVGLKLTRACDLNEETQDGETLGSSWIVHSDENGIILSDDKHNGKQ